MPRILKKWSGVFTGPPELVLATQTVEFPAELFEEPGRPVVLTMPASSIPRMIRSLAALQARYDGTRARMEASDFFASENGDGS